MIRTETGFINFFFLLSFNQDFEFIYLFIYLPVFLLIFWRSPN